MTATKEQIAATISIIKEVGEIIREHKQTALGGVPSGELYTRLMGMMSLNSYQSIIGCLKKAGLVKESGYLLTWIGE